MHLPGNPDAARVGRRFDGATNLMFSRGCQR
jgi:hypothetical protein